VISKQFQRSLVNQLAKQSAKDVQGSRYDGRAVVVPLALQRNSKTSHASKWWLMHKGIVQ
jgi:hypothetical protein